MKTARHIDHKKLSHIVFIIAFRTTLFLFFVTILLFLFFAAGNYQGFGDSELHVVIRITSIAALLLFLIATLTALNALARCILPGASPHRFRYLRYALFLFPAGVIGLAVSIFCGLLEILSAGI